MASRCATVLLNDDLDWSRGKRAAHAVHASLALYKIKYRHALRVLSAKPREIVGDHALFREDGAPLAVAERVGWSLVVRVVVRGSDTRDDTARIAAECALRFYGVEGCVAPRSSTLQEVQRLKLVIHDAGRTELAPGTLTAGAEWTAT